MADQIAQGIADCTAFILRLARAGRRVRVVTDHGWLLIPGGLQKAVLDIAVVEGDGKRTRCARIKAGAPTSYDCAPWSWNADVRVAFATGAMSFYMGYDYAHGGISPQECITPVIDVAPMGATRTVSITKAEWTGLRLKVEVARGADLRVDAGVRRLRGAGGGAGRCGPGSGDAHPDGGRVSVAAVNMFATTC